MPRMAREQRPPGKTRQPGDVWGRHPQDCLLAGREFARGRQRIAANWRMLQLLIISTSLYGFDPSWEDP